jgi:competence protein ComEC
MRRLAVFVSLWILLPGLAFGQANGKLQIHFMDVGQGDGAVIISPLGESVLIDNGGLNQCGKPLAYLQQLGLTRIDYHIASHYHADHIGCTTQVLSLLPLTGFAYDRGGSYTTATYQNYVATVGDKRRTATAGASIVLDAQSATPVMLRFVAMNGNGLPTSDENDLSLAGC